LQHFSFGTEVIQPELVGGVEHLIHVNAVPSGTLIQPSLQGGVEADDVVGVLLIAALAERAEIEDTINGGDSGENGIFCP